MKRCARGSGGEAPGDDLSLGRRDFVRAAVAGALGGLLLPAGCAAPRGAVEGPGAAQGAAQAAAAGKLGIPGPFPGRVVSVRHAGSIANRRIVHEAVRDMVARGMKELAGSGDAVEAWRRFFEPGDVVGVKVNPVGNPHAISSHELVHEVVAGLESAGVARKDIVVFDRYRAQFIQAGYLKNLPEGVRWDASCEDYDNVQLDIAGYDPDVYRELELAAYGHHDPSDPRTRRSHLSLIVSRKVQKIVNLPVLKDHGSAGVTIALKNMSHGFVNNVARSHGTPSSNACNVFIPAICSLPQIREKVVLHICDGLRGMFDGGPGGYMGSTWEQRTLYFATDPVAMDRIGWEVVDAERLKRGLTLVSETRWRPPQSDDDHRRNSFRQPEHIELAAALGLGVFEREQIELKEVDLGAAG
ncbi:MAG: DUF362 domain-containing protein [Planctomycetes bacterium]|nr:DUF362 domain-containing protein [Planctomycetota bacterium]